MSSEAFPKVVVRTGGALLALWALSFALSYVHLGAAALPVALGIAVVKAALVVMFFMELLAERFSVKLTLLTAGALLGILIILVVADLGTRAPAPLLPFGTQAGHTADVPSK